jgi:hypothetical protein
MNLICDAQVSAVDFTLGEGLPLPSSPRKPGSSVVAAAARVLHQDPPNLAVIPAKAGIQ